MALRADSRPSRSAPRKCAAGRASWLGASAGASRSGYARPDKPDPGLLRPASPSGRPAGLEGGHRDRLARAATRPQHELERLVIGLAGVERRLDHRAALRVGSPRAPREAKRVAE